MSYKGTNLDDPLDLELNFDDDSIVEFLEKNLAQVLINTAQMKIELKDLQEKKRQLIIEHQLCPANMTLEPFPEDTDLLQRLNQVTLKAEELMGHLTKLVEAKTKMIKDAKDATIIDLTTLFDQCTIKPTEGQDKTIDGEKKAIVETESKTAAEEAELKKMEYEANNFAMMEELKFLTQIQNNATDTLEQIRLLEALSKEKPSK